MIRSHKVDSEQAWKIEDSFCLNGEFQAREIFVEPIFHFLDAVEFNRSLRRAIPRSISRKAEATRSGTSVLIDDIS